MKYAIPIRLDRVCPRRLCFPMSSRLSAASSTSPYTHPLSPSDLGPRPNLSLLTHQQLTHTPLSPFHDRFNPIQNP